MDTEARNDDGKITLAVLATKLDFILISVNTMNTTLVQHFRESARRDERIALLEQTCVTSEKTMNELHDDVETVKRRTYWWEGINSALALIAGYLGFKN